MENVKPSITLNSSPYPLGFNRRCYSAGLALGLSQSLGPPAKPNPLTDVISQTSPQGFQSYLSQPTQPKLTQSNFILNPRIRKFRHTGALLVNLLSLRRLHLCLKRLQFRALSAPDQRSPSSRPRTTLGLKRTSPTVRSSRSVAAPQRSSLSFLSFIKQHFPRGTSITVSARIILKCLWVKLRTHATLLQPIRGNSVSLRQGPNQINLLLGHHLHRCLIRKASIHHHLLRLLAQIGLDSIYRRFQFPRIRGRLGYPHPHN